MCADYNKEVQGKFDKLVELTEQYGVKVFFDRLTVYDYDNSVLNEDDDIQIKSKDDFLSCLYIRPYFEGCASYYAYYNGYADSYIENALVSFKVFCHIDRKSFTEEEMKSLYEHWMKLNSLCKELNALGIPDRYMLLNTQSIKEMDYGCSPLGYLERAYAKLNLDLITIYRDL